MLEVVLKVTFKIAESEMLANDLVEDALFDAGAVVFLNESVQKELLVQTASLFTTHNITINKHSFGIMRLLLFFKFD